MFSSLLIILAITSVSVAYPNEQYYRRQYRQLQEDSPVQVVEPVADAEFKTLKGPLKFESQVNVTWNNSPINAIINNSVQEILASLTNLGMAGNGSMTALATYISNLAAITSSFSSTFGSYVETMGKLVTAERLTNYGVAVGTSLSRAFNFVGQVIAPVTVIGVFFVGTYFVIYLVVQVNVNSFFY